MLDFANDVREMRREPVMARDVREMAAPERTVKLPRRVRSTATTLVPVDIEISHRETVLSLPVLLR
jgi:hypothetical protein